MEPNLHTVGEMQQANDVNALFEVLYEAGDGSALALIGENYLEVIAELMIVTHDNNFSETISQHSMIQCVCDVLAKVALKAANDTGVEGEEVESDGVENEEVENEGVNEI